MPPKEQATLDSTGSPEEQTSSTVSGPYGLIATFQTPSMLYAAAQKVRDAGFCNWDVFSPFPIHGMDQAMGLKRSKVPVFTFWGGITGFFLGMLMSWYMGEVDYPLIVGGKPFFSPIFTFPIAYELTILLAAFGTLFGMFWLNRLPQHYHSAFNYKAFSGTSDNAFMLLIEKEDPQFDSRKTRAFLEKIGGNTIEEVAE